MAGAYKYTPAIVEGPLRAVVCGMPSRITYGRITPGTYPWYSMCARKKEEEKRRARETRREKKKGKNSKEEIDDRKKNEANMLSRRRPSPEDKVAVCWFVQACDLSS